MEQARSKSDIIWSGKDYKSRTVTLYVQERDHIDTGHEMMQENYHVVYETVKTPDAVYRSAQSEYREVMFRRSENATYGATLTTKVVVDYSKSPEFGYIVSAWPQKEEKGNIDVKLYP